MDHCLKCGHRLGEKDNFCNACGYSVIEGLKRLALEATKERTESEAKKAYIQCNKCGRLIKKDNSFCQYCGSPNEGNNSNEKDTYGKNYRVVDLSEVIKNSSEMIGEKLNELFDPLCASDLNYITLPYEIVCAQLNLPLQQREELRKLYKYADEHVLQIKEFNDIRTLCEGVFRITRRDIKRQREKYTNAEIFETEEIKQYGFNYDNIADILRETMLKLGVKYKNYRLGAYELLSGNYLELEKNNQNEEEKFLEYLVDFDYDYMCRLLNLSPDLKEELTIIYKLADDQFFLITDIRDLKAVCTVILEHIKDYKGSYYFSEKNLKAILRAIVLCECHDYDNDGIETIYSNNKKDISDITTGEEFEQYCANLLIWNGYENVLTTSATGDHGVDITAEKDTITYAIQCKFYSNPVGNSAVQEAYSGKKLYGKDIAVVMTNNVFTKQAIEDARKLGVKMWDGSKLDDLRGDSYDHG